MCRTTGTMISPLSLSLTLSTLTRGASPDSQLQPETCVCSSLENKKTRPGAASGDSTQTHSSPQTFHNVSMKSDSPRLISDLSHDYWHHQRKFTCIDTQGTTPTSGTPLTERWPVFNFHVCADFTPQGHKCSHGSGWIIRHTSVKTKSRTSWDQIKLARS